MFHRLAHAARALFYVQPGDVEDKLRNDAIIDPDIFASAPKRPAGKIKVGPAQVGIAQVGQLRLASLRLALSPSSPHDSMYRA